MGFASYRYEVQYVIHNSSEHGPIDSLSMAENRYYPEFYMAEAGNLVFYTGMLILVVVGNL